MDLDTLRFGNFTSLGTAIDDWSRVVKRLESLEKDAREGLKGLADKANWSGVNATVSREFITKTAGEFTDAHTQATTICNILKDTHDELVGHHDQLVETITRGLKKNLTVMDTGKGSFTVTVNIHPDRAAKGTTVPDHSQQDVDELCEDVKRLLSRATHSDDTAVNFIPVVGDAAQRGVDALAYQWQLDEQARIDDDNARQNGEVFTARENQLQKLSDLWIDANPNHGVSNRYTLTSEINGAAFDGNARAQGLAGDQ
ncbi:hypothetical protein OG824_23035 [Streptomyces prunicolor]|uniref:hypothetical protein n=1 Tax=Streptomyces prunicolor TaxID=67348 RepID=UPI00225B8E20|nr:hypothetical protein [Streptomyces prunicolor]MCX5238076.1 hypothetical protein [Streptomyces prunicolor]